MNFSLETVQTERLHIRKLEEADAQAIFEIFSDSEVARYWSSPPMSDISHAVKFIEETHDGFKDDSLLEWGVIETKGDRLIGTCAYSSWDRVHNRAEIGFALHRDRWGMGYMKELLAAFIPFGIHELGLHRIEADVDPRNTPAIRLLEHFGFKREGYLRERYHLNGEHQDALFFGLLADEFKRR